MKKIKAILIFLAILLGLFMLVGMWYGILFFGFVLKLMVVAGIIGYGVYIFNKK